MRLRSLGATLDRAIDITVRRFPDSIVTALLLFGIPTLAIALIAQALHVDRVTMRALAFLNYPLEMFAEVGVMTILTAALDRELIPPSRAMAAAFRLSFRTLSVVAIAIVPLLAVVALTVASTAIPLGYARAHLDKPSPLLTIALFAPIPLASICLAVFCYVFFSVRVALAILVDQQSGSLRAVTLAAQRLYTKRKIGQALFSATYASVAWFFPLWIASQVIGASHISAEAGTAMLWIVALPFAILASAIAVVFNRDARSGLDSVPSSAPRRLAALWGKRNAARGRTSKAVSTGLNL